MNKNANIIDFFNDQIGAWDTAQKNFSDLNRVENRSFIINEFPIRVQCNPARIRSTAANVDSKHIANRKCFLCAENRPQQQFSLNIFSEFDLLVNPFPIFPKHFTIAAKKHLHQDLADFNIMAEFANKMSGFVLFYNASNSGASAPDHLHFQAGNKDFLPICDYVKKADNEEIKISSDVAIIPFTETPMPFFLIKSPLDADIDKIINRISGENQLEKSLRNILIWVENTQLFTIIFPRKKHRPDCYFADEPYKLLVSPGAVDMAGVIILPRMEDFEKITIKNLIDIYSQVSPDASEMMQKLNRIRQ